jgi:2-dehydro-3-deoxygluconokinase
LSADPADNPLSWSDDGDEIRMTIAPKRVACIGECMIELNETEGGALQRAFGGDTLNTAIYLARCLKGTGIAVDYVTALGDDPFSAEMIEAWRREGVGTEAVVRLPGKLPGLYLIRTDEVGERSFHYWRSAAAAREMFAAACIDEVRGALVGSDLVYLSSITIAILGDEGRQTLLGTLDRLRDAKGKVAFDSNYRPALWPDPNAAVWWMTEVLRRTDVALPSFEDEANLFADPSAEATAERLHGLGVGEVVVKNGPEPCFVSAPEFRGPVAAERVVRPIDTTAAGDSFNAAYLAARLKGNTPEAAAKEGHALAARVICQPGAIAKDQG